MSAVLVRRKVLLASGRRSHRESLPLDGSVPMPQEPFEDYEDEPKKKAATKVVDGKTIFPPCTPTNEDTTMGRNIAAGMTRQKFVDLFAGDKARWMKIAEVAKATGVPRVNCKYHLTALAEQGVIKARGATTARAYAHIDAPEIAVMPKAEPAPAAKERRPATRRKTTRAKRQRHAATPSLPIPVPMPAPMAANEDMALAINDSGALGISKGAERIALEPADIASLLRFLDNTKPIWRRKRAA